jgi:hypothetical protein
MDRHQALSLVPAAILPAQTIEATIYDAYCQHQWKNQRMTQHRELIGRFGNSVFAVVHAFAVR